MRDNCREEHGSGKKGVRASSTESGFTCVRHSSGGQSRGGYSRQKEENVQGHRVMKQHAVIVFKELQSPRAVWL